MATELAVCIPLVLLLLVFIGVANRGVSARQDVDSTAEAAARAASLQRDPVTARAAAAQAAAQNLGDGRVTCTPLVVDVDVGGFEPGGSVTVTVHCTVNYADLAAGFPIPGALIFSSSATSPIDLWRGVSLGFANTEASSGSN
jgi:Flp pilus assembly protein TadG